LGTISGNNVSFNDAAFPSTAINQQSPVSLMKKVNEIKQEKLSTICGDETGKVIFHPHYL